MKENLEKKKSQEQKSNKKAVEKIEKKNEKVDVKPAIVKVYSNNVTTKTWDQDSIKEIIENENNLPSFGEKSQKTPKLKKTKYS